MNVSNADFVINYFESNKNKVYNTYILLENNEVSIDVEYEVSRKIEYDLGVLENGKLSFNRSYRGKESFN